MSVLAAESLSRQQRAPANAIEEWLTNGTGAPPRRGFVALKIEDDWRSRMVQP